MEYHVNGNNLVPATKPMFSLSLSAKHLIHVDPLQQCEKACSDLEQKTVMELIEPISQLLSEGFPHNLHANNSKVIKADMQSKGTGIKRSSSRQLKKIIREAVKKHAFQCNSVWLYFLA